MTKGSREPRIYSYWVVEVDHSTETAQVDLAATDFWISKQFSPESNIMYFTERKNGPHKRNMVELDLTNPEETVWDMGRKILEKALAAIKPK